ncbi:Hypothetical_protein [Hexamita inflata]|uniref:Hypothetical_protein n=1 Tax=Hexamita inflata TaxID=28002 RepID=A0AA86PXU6_9EUKA|nr:Hypothetical protein HINF_LOCUS35676 [Hexamita inflata]
MQQFANLLVDNYFLLHFGISDRRTEIKLLLMVRDRGSAQNLSQPGYYEALYYCRLSKIATTPNLVNRLLSPIASELVSLTDFSFDIMRLLKNLTYFTFKYCQQINNNLAILNKQISTCSHEH